MFGALISSVISRGRGVGPSLFFFFFAKYALVGGRRLLSFEEEGFKRGGGEACPAGLTGGLGVL